MCFMCVLTLSAYILGLNAGGLRARWITEVLQAIATIIDRLQGGIRTRARTSSKPAGRRPKLQLYQTEHYLHGGVIEAGRACPRTPRQRQTTPAGTRTPWPVWFCAEPR